MCNVIKTKELKFVINKFCETANMPRVGLEIFKAGGVLPLHSEQAKCRILELEAGKAYAFSAEEVGETLLFLPLGSMVT
ncbi:hypothetical protein T4E_3802 [Trichinella pseudospiralis]|uniref:Uncharacterized protein n=1 Tax=Trichinella pseudospiralis TaxID=6337 RepID=A0A0V0XWX8_TRIPS|nr:hypothetical protein T4E_3802 [Trichinella pseudospiralis]